MTFQLWPLETSRLVIRHFADDDLDAVAAVLDACFGPAPLSAHQAWLDWTVRNYAALLRLHQPPYGDYAITLRSTGALIGSVGLVPSFGPFAKLPGFEPASAARSPHLNRPEMGLFWALAPAHRGLGYATEAALAMTNAAFHNLDLYRIVATTEHDNAASIAVMRRVGMRILVNPDPRPPWFQTVGVMENPALASRTKV